MTILDRKRHEIANANRGKKLRAYWKTIHAIMRREQCGCRLAQRIYRIEP